MTWRPRDGQVRQRALNLKTTREIREKLEAAALASGRSLTQEVEYRVQRSFDQEEVIAQTVAWMMAHMCLVVSGGRSPAESETMQ